MPPAHCPGKRDCLDRLALSSNARSFAPAIVDSFVTNASSEAYMKAILLCTRAFILVSGRTLATNASIEAQDATLSLFTSVRIPVSAHTPAANAIFDVRIGAISIFTASVHTRVRPFAGDECDYRCAQSGNIARQRCDMELPAHG